MHTPTRTTQFIYYLLKVLAYVPSFVVKAFSRLAYFLLYRVMQYRRDVVRTNITNCLSRNEKDLKAIEKKYYKHLSNLLLNSLRYPFYKPSQLRKSFRFENLESIEALRAKGVKNIVLVMGHCGEWELFAAAPYYLKERGFINVNVYKKLSNATSDELMQLLRARHNSIGVETQDIARYLIARERDKQVTDTAIVTFIADQCPFLEASHYGTLFFNQPTLFISGWERLARKLALPVVYMDIYTDKNGQLVGALKLLCENAATTQPFQLVELYKEELEASIYRNPVQWLWSHKRWRFQPQQVEGITLSKACGDYLEQRGIAPLHAQKVSF